MSLRDKNGIGLETDRSADGSSVMLPGAIRRHPLRKAVAQVSNLLYRRFPIGNRWKVPDTLEVRTRRRLEAPRYSRLEVNACQRNAGCEVA